MLPLTTALDQLCTDIYNKLLSLKGRNIELEVRLGKINDLQTDNRITLPSKLPVVFYNNKIYKFTPGVFEIDFQYYKNKVIKLKKDIKNEENEEKVETSTEIGNCNYTETILNYLKGSEIFVDEFEDEQLLTKNARVTVRDDKIVECVRKNKLTNFDIFLPDSLYDIRVSISEEAPVPNAGEYDMNFVRRERDNRFTFRRNRKRLSAKNDKISFDLTRVKMNRTVVSEVEIELNNRLYEDKEEIKNFVGYFLEFLGKRE